MTREKVLCTRNNKTNEPSLDQCQSPNLDGHETLFGTLVQIRMPEIDDQNNSIALSLVPDFVIERVVKDEESTFLPSQELISHTQLQVAPFRGRRHFEAEMSPQSTIGGSGMRMDVGTGLHDAELDLTPLVGDGSRDLGQE